MDSSGMIHMSDSMKTDAGVKVIFRFCLRSFKSRSVGITDGNNL
jgi:hypothetical protein